MNIHLSNNKSFKEFFEGQLGYVQKEVNRRLASMSTEFSDLDVKIDPRDDGYEIKIAVSSDLMQTWPAGNAQQNGIELKNGIVFSNTQWSQLSNQELSQAILKFVHSLKNGNSV